MWVLNWRGEKKKRKGDANPHRKHLWCTKASSSCSGALYFTFSRLTYKGNEHLVVFLSVLIQLRCKFLPHKEASRSILRFSFLFPCDVYTWGFLLPTPQNSLAVMNAPSTPPWPAPRQVWEEDRQYRRRSVRLLCAAWFSFPIRVAIQTQHLPYLQEVVLDLSHAERRRW